MDFQAWLSHAEILLSQSESPKLDALVLLEYVTGKSRAFVRAFSETRLSDEQQDTLSALLTRRINGEPIAYLTGEREFWSLPLQVSPATLIPRPDTECLVEQALAHLPENSCHILDLGTGSGAIALALASERPDCEVTAVDIMTDAVDLAKVNAKNLGITNINIFQSNWFNALNAQKFALIVSNPPYIDANDPHLAQGDVRFEPITALVAEKEGMADIDILVIQSRTFLECGGWLMIEHGWKQGEKVRNVFLAAGFKRVSTIKDYGDNERLTIGQYFS